ncbi:sugar ABC transporter ATP-binding protein [Komagataeibacter nataicola]|uniref:Sugar ABC transporter ATP-binding protein n=1 Tax=Komagataeibacter nataicola TaxID=265960 RepID=A0A9N7H3M2_9PROT|nr:sugar ABC transporter ATP-binding protein [Komagataeibacter nataicola]AQU88698.1 sugar ABC transporter ATP-binding protein [Komagataeibacter nataicola]PYD66697.1 sugar ABC transporter ATP-binding protein [Komagataeibacter nataicola]WEQ57053.1 sugar ABC transporter ATP-binding protein [Komagataeibacter nataicola]WNM08584.1 sugar ABC transporter ATP-binding protein [Komagataeibacter nataicola]GBR26199.1 ribose ABC transporter ATP-binding protein [Komagataeibacter nataicola NRIC 0616]
MTVLHVSSLRKTYPGVVALDHVDLTLEAGKVHILAGENGAGKSTLIKVLTGLVSPDAGSVEIEGHDALADRALFARVAYVPQELSLFPTMTVAENMFMPFAKSGFGRMTVSRTAMEAAAQKLMTRFGMHARPGQKVGHISVPDQQLLQIARAASAEDFRVLILDEPTSSLTSSETEHLFSILRTLRDEGCAIVFVSHRMEEIFALGDTVTVLRNGRSVGTCPMAELDEGELIRLMSGNSVQLDESFQPGVASGTQDVIVDVAHLSGPGFTDASFTLRRGEILGFAGLVGAGRSELMQTMFGYHRATAGRCVLDGHEIPRGRPDRAVAMGMLYLPEERRHHGIFPLLSVRENIAVSVMDQIMGGGVISSGRERRVVADAIERFDVRTSSAEKKIMYLSGGNQQKAIIGRAMARRPRVLIFDEPTKGIDIGTKFQIYRIMQQLAEEGVGIILVSSEMAELQRCATRIITMHAGRITGSFDQATTDINTLVGAIIGAPEVRHVA